MKVHGAMTFVFYWMHTCFWISIYYPIQALEFGSPGLVQRDMEPFLSPPQEAAVDQPFLVARPPGRTKNLNRQRQSYTRQGGNEIKPWEPEEQPDPAEGQWGEWSSWSQCDINCEKIRTRTCQGTPRPEGIQCRGPYKHRNKCDPDVCQHMASADVPDLPEQKGAAFHVDGRLEYRASGVPTHAINIFIRFKPLISNAVIIERYPPKTCHTSSCKNSVVLALVKQKLELRVSLDQQKLKITGINKINLNGWHTVIILVFHSKASMSIDNKEPLTASFKPTPPPVNLDQPMNVGFMGRRVLSMTEALKEISGYISELRINYKSASLVPSDWRKGHLRPIREERLSHVAKEVDSMYPPFAGEQFTSFPLLNAQKNNGVINFRILFSTRYNPRAVDREIVFFLPGHDDHSYVFIGTTAMKFYICVKRTRSVRISCSHGHQFKAGRSNLSIQLNKRELIVRWKKGKTGLLYQQSARLTDDNSVWKSSNIVYLGGLPTALWNVLGEESNANSLKGFTGYIYSLVINGKKLSLKKGTVYSKDGLVNAFGATEADDYTEVARAESADKIAMTCDYARNVRPTDVVNVKWLNGNKVVVPSTVNNVAVTIQDAPIEKFSVLTMKIVGGNNTLNAQQARKEMEGFYACQLNRNEDRFLVAAFGVTNASSSDSEGAVTAWRMQVPEWMVKVAISTGMTPKAVVIISILLLTIIVISAFVVTLLYLFNNDPVFRQWLKEASGGKILHDKSQKPKGDKHDGSQHGGSKHSRHRTELYHEPQKPPPNTLARAGITSRDYPPGNISTNCGTDIEGNFDELSGSEFRSSEMDGLLTEDTLQDEDDDTTEVFDTYDEEDSLETISSESNTTVGRYRHHGRRHRRGRSRSPLRDDRRPRSGSGGRRRSRSRSRSRDRKSHRRHRRHGHRHRRPTYSSPSYTESEYSSYLSEAVDRSTHINRESPVGDDSQRVATPNAEENRVQRKASAQSVKSSVRQRNSSTNVKANVPTTTTAAATQKVPATLKGTASPRTGPTGAPARQSAAPAATKANNVQPPKVATAPVAKQQPQPSKVPATGVVPKQQQRPLPPKAAAATVPKQQPQPAKVATATVPRQQPQPAKVATATVPRQQPQPAKVATASIPKQQPQPAKVAGPPVPRQTSPAATSQAKAAATKTQPATTRSPQATAVPKAPPPPQAKQGAVPAAKPAVKSVNSSPQAQKAQVGGAVRATSNAQPKQNVSPVTRSPDDQNYAHVHDYSWRNPSPPYSTAPGSTNYVETFDERGYQPQRSMRSYAESEPGHYSDRGQLGERRSYVYPPSLGLSRGCSSASWLNINENARPQSNENENARPEDPEVYSPEQAYLQEDYSPSDWAGVDHLQTIEEISESSLAEDTSRQDETTEESSEHSSEAPQEDRPSPVRAYMEDILSRMPSYHFMPSISEE